jgi:hypothetical protein
MTSLARSSAQRAGVLAFITGPLHVDRQAGLA